MLNKKVSTDTEAFDYAINKTLVDGVPWFFINLLNYEALEWQIRACEVVVDVHRIKMGLPTFFNHEGKQRVSIRSCHGTGKTELLALLIHLWNFLFYAKIACTAPKEQQLLKRLLPRYRSIKRNSAPEYGDRISVMGREIRIEGDEDWGANMETASEPDNLAGYHDNPQLFLIDEGSAKRLDPMYPVIEGALSTIGSVSVEIGNPTRTVGEFYNHHNKTGVKDLYYLMHIRYTDALKIIDMKWVRTMALKYGEKSPIYQVRVEGEFASADNNQLMPLTWMEEARDRPYAKDGDGSHPKIIISVDVADGGADMSNITVKLKYESFELFLKQREFSFPAHKASKLTANEAIKMYVEFDGPSYEEHLFIVDGIGVGTGTVGDIMNAGFTVIGFKGGSTDGVDTTKHRNKRAKCSISMRDAHRDGTVAYAEGFFDDPGEWDDYFHEVLAVRTKPGIERVEDVLTKIEIVDLLGFSPNRFDSVMMGYATDAPVIGEQFVEIMTFGELSAGVSNGLV